MEQHIDYNSTPPKQILPYSTAVLVLGIMSIVSCWIQGIIGVILGIIALVLSGKSRQFYEANPSLYSETSLKNVNAGRVCAIVGISLSGLFLLIIIFWLLLFGLTGFLTFFPWEQITHSGLCI